MSGIEFDCSHFPGTFYSREVHHPVFNLPQKRLLNYTQKWAGGELTPTDSYLLFLALLNSSDRVDFRVPACRNEFTDSIIANNMEYLIRTVIKINTVTHPAQIFPAFVISPDTKFLGNVHYWIENWEEAYKKFLSGARRDIDDRKLVHREAALQRMIKNPHKKVSEYASQIADWAATAGSFPTFLTISPYSTESRVPIGEYWKTIISKCARAESLFSIPKKDLAELLEHCEENIPMGSIFSNALFKLLRYAQDKQANFLNIGDFDVTSTYKLLEESTTAEDANMKALVDSAPTEMPRLEQYPSKFQFMRAKLRWDMSRRYGKEKSSEDNSPPPDSIVGKF